MFSHGDRPDQMPKNNTEDNAANRDHKAGKAGLSDFDGTLTACVKRQNLCGYACCQFGKLGNWIFALPGEVETARQLNLTTDHLSITKFEEGHALHCNRPCTEGEFKPLDCSWYPLYPAAEDATLFIVADHRKCPIPNKELIEHARLVGQKARAWDQAHPGSLKAMVASAREFKAYAAFPYRIGVDGEVSRLTREECAAFAPTSMLDDDFQSEWSVTVAGYTRHETPD